MAGKRYYWLKLQVSFFQELIIKQLRTLPEGDSIVLLYLKLLLKAINAEGIIYYQNILPSSVMLSSILRQGAVYDKIRWRTMIWHSCSTKKWTKT